MRFILLFIAILLSAAPALADQPGPAGLPALKQGLGGHKTAGYHYANHVQKKQKPIYNLH